MQRVRPPARANVADQLVECAVGAVMGRDDAHASAPHRERERRFEQSLQVLVKSGLVDHGASLLAAQVGGARRERDDFVARGEADAVREDVARLIVHRDFLDPARDAIEFARPPGGGLDELQRHVLVVADVPGVHAAFAGGGQRAIGGLAPGDSDPARFFADLDLRAVGDPFALIRQQEIEAVSRSASQLDLHQSVANGLFHFRRETRLAGHFRYFLVWPLRVFAPSFSRSDLPLVHSGQHVLADRGGIFRQHAHRCQRRFGGILGTCAVRSASLLVHVRRRPYSCGFPLAARLITFSECSAAPARPGRKPDSVDSICTSMSKSLVWTSTVSARLISSLSPPVGFDDSLRLLGRVLNRQQLQVELVLLVGSAVLKARCGPRARFRAIARAIRSFEKNPSRACRSNSARTSSGSSSILPRRCSRKGLPAFVRRTGFSSVTDFTTSGSITRAITHQYLRGRATPAGALAVYSTTSTPCAVSFANQMSQSSPSSSISPRSRK